MNRFGSAMLGLFGLLAVVTASLLGGTGPAVETTEGAAETEPSGAVPFGFVAPSGLVIPVAGFRPDQMVDSWGDERGDGTRWHQGLDIMAPRGTPVLAARAGTVERLFSSEAGGLTVYVRGEDGFVYYYAHLDRYRPGLQEGQQVSAGEPIATVGDSGNAAPGDTHLHFGVYAMRPGERWSQGTAINPYPLLAGSGSGS